MEISSREIEPSTTEIIDRGTELQRNSPNHAQGFKDEFGEFPWLVGGYCNGVGSKVIERLHFLASLPLAITGQREGGEKKQPFNRFQSRLGSYIPHRNF